MRHTLLTLTLLATTATTKAQWQLQDAHTTADLRGIDNVGGGVAWASGSNGTILRTEDAGFVWQLCAKPPNAEHLDFRAIQAFDNNTAIIMSSGKGDLSRLHKTTDGCQSWKLIFTNPDPGGFWDGLQMQIIKNARSDGKEMIVGTLIGDPVNGVFPIFSTFNGDIWLRGEDATLLRARNGEALFAASNSAFLRNGAGEIFVTGGAAGSRSLVESEYVKHDPHVSWKYVGGNIPLPTDDSAGAFSIATSRDRNEAGQPTLPEPDRVYFADMKANYVVVGGDYKKPDSGRGTAAFSSDGGQHWTSSTIPPHGYRSAVAYDAPTKTWITVGPNGTDISTDDGRNWHALKPDPAFNDTPDADQHWNALSLPYVVGPHGRIATLRPSALTPGSK